MKFRYHALARKELIEAAKYFDRAERGLGMRFLKAVDDAISSIMSAPEAWPVIWQDEAQGADKGLSFTVSTI